MQLPGMLGSLPSRLRTVAMAKALLQLGCLLMQLRGAAVGGKLLRLGSPSPFQRSPQLLGFLHHHPYSAARMSSLRQPART